MIQIRQAVKEDVATIFYFDRGARDDVTLRQLVTDAVSGECCYVAVLSGRVVGYVILDYTFFRSGFIPLLHVHQDFRRRGIASKLLSHVENLDENDPELVYFKRLRR